MASLTRYVSPERWRRFITGRIELIRRERAATALDAAWKEVGPIRVSPGPATVIADGLWLNPGYFLRLRLMIDALARTQSFKLIGVLSTGGNVRERRALERIGFDEFIHVDADQQFPVENFQAQAGALLAGVRTHADLLRIQLPHQFPPYLWYDSVLKSTRHGRPPVEHPEWRRELAETLAYLSIYDRVLNEREVSKVLLSHAWGTKWAALAWLALGRGITTFLVTAFSDAIRIRRFRSRADLETPVEFMTRSGFDALPSPVRNKIVAFGAAQLSERQQSRTADVNVRHAYVPDRRSTDRQRAREMLGIKDDRPIGVIYGHSWFDFPHLYGMRNFTDFVDWFEVTLESIATIQGVTWLLKPHPMEGWYGGQKMIENLGELPAHVRVLQKRVDTVTVMSAADAIVTVHGTAALEAAAQGVPVIAADRSYYSDWGFVHLAADRDEYRSLLKRVGQFPSLTASQRDLARACFAFAYAEPEAGALRVPCDSMGSDLYRWVNTTISTAPQSLAAEVERLSQFLAQDEIDSFAANALVQWASRDLKTVAA